MKPNTVPAVTTMLQGMDDSAFGQFVAALWEQQGWQTQVKRDDGKTFVAVQRPQSGEEGLLWAVPASGGEVGGKQVQQFVSLCKEYGVDEAAIVSAGEMSDHAEKVATGTQIELLDGEGVAKFVKRRELTHLVEKYGGGDGGGDGSDAGGDGGDSPLDRVKPVVGRAAALAGSVGTKGVVAAAVVAVALVAAGVLGGSGIPLLGGGGDGISAASASPDDPEASLHVTWNAKTTDAVDPNESDDLAYPAPEGRQFVVVAMSVNNTGTAQVPLEQSAFEFEANGTTYENVTLAEHDGSIAFPIGPGERFPVWTVFAVPEGTGESGTLVYDQNATDLRVAVEFERDSELPAEVTA